MNAITPDSTPARPSEAAPICVLWVDPWLEKDGIFNPSHAYNRDDQYHPVRALRQAFSQQGWALHTQDVVVSKGVMPEAVIFFDIPKSPVKKLLGKWPLAKRYAVLFECALIKPHNWVTARHAQFDRIYTWHTDLIATPPYVESYFPQNFLCQGINRAVRKKLCVMIAGNKLPRGNNPLELYSKRKEAIRWFENHAPADFDLYGTGWSDATIPHSFRIKKLGLMGLANMLFPIEPRPSYRGMVAEKRSTLQNYKFSIAFENARDIPGYITEKIFDSLLAGCIPIYWGAPNITNFVPADCFIDFRDFLDYGKLYEFLTGMSENQRQGYLDRIDRFLLGDGPQRFSSEFWASNLCKHVVRDKTMLPLGKRA